MQPEEVYPLTICYGDFFVGGASWYWHRQRHPGCTMASFLRARLRHNEGTLRRMRDFYRSFDSSILEERKRRRVEARGLPLIDPKEEPTEESFCTFEDRRFNFFHRPVAED